MVAPPKLEPIESSKPSASSIRRPSASIHRPSASPTRNRGSSTSPAGRDTAPEPPALNPRPVVGRKEKAQAVKASHHETTVDEDAQPVVLYSTGSRGANQTVGEDEKWAEQPTLPQKKIDWAGFIQRLPPLDGSAESKEKRDKIFGQFDVNGNGYLSLAELDKGILGVLNLHESFEVPKPVTMRAFQASKDAYKAKGKSSKGDDYVTRAEFRLFFVWIRQYYELWQMFDLVDSGDDRRIDLDEFKRAAPNLVSWGLKLDDPEASFAEVDQNGGGIVLFDEFAHWALVKHLDEKADDDFDDEAIEGQAPPTIEEAQKEEEAAAEEPAADAPAAEEPAAEEPAAEEPAPPVRKIDWAGFIQRLPPLDGSAESKEKRDKIFGQFDVNGNGYLSLAELDKGILGVLNLHESFEVPKPVTMRAFQASKDAYKAKGKSSKGDDYVTRAEFRLFFVWIRQYYELWQMFDLVDSGDDRRIDLDEFKRAAPNLVSWGLKLDDPEASFAEVDQNGGGIVLFDEFAHWALVKHLDEKADDDFDDEAIEGQAPPTIEEAQKEEEAAAEEPAADAPAEEN